MKKNFIKTLPFVSFFTPLAVYAQDLEEVMDTIKRMVDRLVPLFMVLAVAVFFWGIVKYITAAGDAEKEKVARGYILYGLLGIFVLVAFWGLIMIVANTLGITPGGGSFVTPITP
jgi:fumarate reductase subunit D